MSRAGDFDYERLGPRYRTHRRTDPTIAATVWAGLGPARRVLNVGAGAGSYEPDHLDVVAVEPSAAMRAVRPPGGPPVVDARAEDLPFAAGTFDATMATATVHQWADLATGLAEMGRVSRGCVIVLTFDADELDRFWLARYAPELVEAERRRLPRIDEICARLGGAQAQTVPVPFDCVDGFTEAYYGRPERFLDESVRRAQSAWSFVDRPTEDRAVAHLTEDLASGHWDRQFGDLRHQATYLGSLRLIVAAA